MDKRVIILSQVLYLLGIVKPRPDCNCTGQDSFPIYYALFPYCDLFHGVVNSTYHVLTCVAMEPELDTLFTTSNDILKPDVLLAADLIHDLHVSLVVIYCLRAQVYFYTTPHVKLRIKSRSQILHYITCNGRPKSDLKFYSTLSCY